MAIENFQINRTYIPCDEKYEFKDPQQKANTQ